MQQILNMNNGILLLLFIFLHVCADFNFQGQMEKLKQKEFWKKYDKKYQFDYVMPLIGHAFQWAFIVHVPVIFHSVLLDSSILEFYTCASIVLHTGIHAYVDTLRANDKKITLIQDQFYHLLQLIVIWAVFCWLK